MRRPPPEAATRPRPRPVRHAAAEQRRLLASAAVPSFERHLERAGVPPLVAGPTEVLQLNVGRLCNQTCRHCHVDAGPHRTAEVMDGPTFGACLEVARRIRPRTVDLTGGAPELNPHFRRFVREVRAIGVEEVIDRCNLTVLLLPGQGDLVAFLAQQGVRVVASLPSPHAEPTDAQRGEGVFERSLEALRRLNAHGYGIEGTGLRLTLTSNPAGAFLPPAQAAAEARFREVLARRWGIVFTDLLTLTNLPVNRFLDHLVARGGLEPYLRRLSETFNPAAVAGLMCRHTLSVAWDGTLYDCDFNQMLEVPVRPAASRTIFSLRRDLLEGRRIRVGRHCLGCTAGQGSSCGGATT